MKVRPFEGQEEKPGKSYTSVNWSHCTVIAPVIRTSSRRRAYFLSNLLHAKGKDKTNQVLVETKSISSNTTPTWTPRTSRDETDSFNIRVYPMVNHCPDVDPAKIFHTIPKKTTNNSVSVNVWKFSSSCFLHMNHLGFWSRSSGAVYPITWTYGNDLAEGSS